MLAGRVFHVCFAIGQVYLILISNIDLVRGALKLVMVTVRKLVKRNKICKLTNFNMIETKL